MKSLQLVIRGNVQGVGFRAATKKVADVLQVTGFVKNLPDGAVEVVVTGEEALVHKLVDFCHHGPAGASVDTVSINFGPDEAFSAFEIRR
ncbi:MAG: acylphosphatase [Chitinophagales bacterium]